MSKRLTGKTGLLQTVLVTAFIFTLFQGSAPAAPLVARGSDSTIEVVQALADAFGKKGGGQIKVEGGGSSKGAKDCLAGEVPLAFMSRGAKESETAAGLVAVAYAIDGVAVVVHKSNPMEAITLDQLKAIYTGQMKNWPDGKPMLAFNRATTSGTREVFQHIVLGEKTEFDASIQIKHDKAALATVAKAPTALAYTSAGEVSEGGEVKILKVNGMVPSPENLRSKAYPIVRTLHFATKGQPGPDVKAFLEFVLSAEGQGVVQKAGYVPLK